MSLWEEQVDTMGRGIVLGGRGRFQLGWSQKQDKKELEPVGNKMNRWLVVGADRRVRT